MPSFDITSKVDVQTLDNAVNIAKKEIDNRYDFKGTHTVLELDKKEMVISVEVESDMKLKQIVDVHFAVDHIVAELIARALDVAALDAAAGHPRRETLAVVIAAVGALGVGRPAKLAAPQHQRVLQQPARSQVG